MTTHVVLWQEFQVYERVSLPRYASLANKSCSRHTMEELFAQAYTFIIIFRTRRESLTHLMTMFASIHHSMSKLCEPF